MTATFLFFLVGNAIISNPATQSGGSTTDAPTVEQYLLSGELAKGEEAMTAALKAKPADDQARFGLGAVQFLRSIERLGQSLYRAGFQQPQPMMMIAAFRFPYSGNPNPQKISYAGARAILQTWVDDLKRVEATLAVIKDPAVKLRLHFGQIRMDLDGDGQASSEEMLWRVYELFNRGANVSADDAAKFVICFDLADAQWLRGYCHLMMGLGEIALAYDEKELFERTAHLLFKDPESPYGFLPNGEKVYDFGGADVMDFIAVVHLFNFQLSDPDRLKAALGHLEAMISLSRDMWKAALAETDDDCEWIPNPKQTGVIPGVKITDEMVAGWQEFLSEADALFAGKRLAPFWRSSELGINLRRFFTEPKPFDLVLWVQGTGAAPYLEKGSITNRAVWERLQRVFQGEFIGFAIWLN